MCCECCGGDSTAGSVSNATASEILSRIRRWNRIRPFAAPATKGASYVDAALYMDVIVGYKYAKVMPVEC